MMTKDDKSPLMYCRGLFDIFFAENNCGRWDSFPDTMWRLGFKMDCEHSFEEFKEYCGLTLKEPLSRRDQFRNNLYVLEHAPRQIVGNYVLSYWRYLTHWSMGWDEYDEDFLRRSLRILEQKFEEGLISGSNEK